MCHSVHREEGPLETGGLYGGVCLQGHLYQSTSNSQKMQVSDVKPIKLSEASSMEIVESPKVAIIEENC